DFAVDLAEFHVQRVAPTVDPIAVERLIIVRPRDSDLEIHGTLDLIAKPSGIMDLGATEVIRDLKTSEKSPPADAAELSQQLTYYSLIRQAEGGAMPSRVGLDHLVRTPKTSTKKYIPQRTTRDRADVVALVN